MRWGLGEAEERIGHEVLRISGRQITGESPEEFELLALVAAAMAHGNASRRSAARLAGGRRNVGAMALCRQHGADARVGGGRLGAPIHPGLQVLDAIDDATAELRIARAGSVDPVLLESADGKADEPGGLGACAGNAVASRRDWGTWVTSVILSKAAGRQRLSEITVAEKVLVGGW